MVGIYFKLSNPNSEVCGFVHASGQLDILGLIQVTIDVYISLCYRSQDNTVYGWAEISIKIEYFFFSLEVTLRAERKFAGSGSASGPGFRANHAIANKDTNTLAAAAEDICCPRPSLNWKEFREAFA